MNDLNVKMELEGSAEIISAVAELRKAISALNSASPSVKLKSEFKQVGNAAEGMAREIERSLGGLDKKVAEALKKSMDDAARQAAISAKSAGKKVADAFVDGQVETARAAQAKLQAAYEFNKSKYSYSMNGLLDMKSQGVKFLPDDKARLQAFEAAVKSSAGVLAVQRAADKQTRDQITLAGAQAKKLRAGLALDHIKDAQLEGAAISAVQKKDLAKRLAFEVAAATALKTQSKGLELDRLKDIQLASAAALAEQKKSLAKRLAFEKEAAAALRAESKALAADQARDSARMAADSLTRIRRQVAVATASPSGQYSVSEGAGIGRTVGAAAGLKAVTEETNKASVAGKRLIGTNKSLTAGMNDLHSTARGLASGFGAMWLTWGNIAPLLAGAAISNAVVQTIKAGAQVDDTMSRLRVLSDESTESVAGLNQQLLELARSGPFGPLEIAQAMKTLALAGLSAVEVSSSIKDVLNFSISGDLGIQAAAEAVTTIATAFGVSATGFSYVTDVISKAAAESKSSVEDLAAAFKTASVINQQFGVSLEETAVGLSLLANAGIKGTLAGTALRNMFVDLAGRTGKVQKELDDLGVNTIDKLTGKMRGMGDIFKDLMSSLEKNRDVSGATKSLSIIFSERGSKEAFAILEALKRDAKDASSNVANIFDELVQKVHNSAAFTALAMAEISLTPLQQMKSVGATMQSVMVEAFQSVQPYILSISNRLKEMINSEGFRSGLQSLMVTVGEATLFIVDHAKALAQMFLGYMAFRSAATIVAGVSGAMRALAFATTGVSTAVGVLAFVTRTATVANPLLLALAAAVTLGGIAWTSYSLWAEKGAAATQKNVDIDRREYLNNLVTERDRLREINQANSEGIPLEALRARNGLSKANTAAGGFAALEKAVADAKANLAKVSSDGSGTGDAMAKRNSIKLTNELRLAESVLSKAQDDRNGLLRKQGTVYAEVIVDGEKRHKFERDAAADRLSADAARFRAAALKAEAESLTKAQIAASKAAREHSQDYLRSLQKEAEQSGLTAEQVKKLGVAKEAALAPTKQLGLEILIQGQRTADTVKSTKDAADAAAALAEANNRLRESERARVQALESSLPGMIQSNKSLADEIAMIGLTEEAQFDLSQSRLLDIITMKEQAVARLQNTEFMGREQIALEEEIRLLKERRALNSDKFALTGEARLREEAGEKSKKIFEDATKDAEKFTNELNQGITDALFRAFESGKGFFKSLWDTVRNLFKTTVLKMIVQPISGALTGALGVGATGAGSAAGGMLNGASMLSSGLQLGSLSNLSSVAGWLGAGTTAGASAASVGLANTVGALGGDALGTFIAANGGWAGVAGGAAGTAIAGPSAAMLAGTTSGAMGVAGAAGGGAATGAAAGLAAIPVVGWIALAAAAVIAFGGRGKKKTEGQGIVGNFGDDGFEGSSYLDWKQSGGWFSGSREDRDYTDLPAETLKTLSTSFLAIRSSSDLAAKSLGVSSDEITNFSTRTSVALTDDAAKNEVAVAGMFTKIADEIAAIALGGGDSTKTETIKEQVAVETGSYMTGRNDDIRVSITEMREVERVVKTTTNAFAREGETASVTLARLSSSLLASNSWAKALGQTLFDVSLAGGEAASKLIDAFGGLENMTAGLDAYFESFYSDAEKRAVRITSIVDALNIAGGSFTADQVGSATRETFRSVVEAQDRTTDAGRTMYAALIGVSGAFAELTVNAEEASAALSETARINAGLQDKLDLMTGAKTERELELRDAVDDSTKALLRQIYAQEDLTIAAQNFADAAAALLDNTTNAASDAYAGLQRAVQAQQAADLAAYEAQKAIAEAAFTSQSDILDGRIASAREALDSVGESVGKLRSLSSSLKSTLDGMQIIGSDGPQRAQAQSQISDALARARSGGGLPLNGELDNALRAVGKPSEQLFGSFVDYAKDFYRTANDISDLSALTDSQLTSAEQAQLSLTEQITLLDEQKDLLKFGFQDQISALDNILENARLQLDAANGINVSVLSVAEALVVFNAAKAKLETVRASQDLVTTPGVADTRAGQIRDYVKAIQSDKGLTEGGRAQLAYAEAKRFGTTEAEVAKALDVSAEEVRQYFGSNGIPRFAVGTNYVPHDMLAMIHKGEAVVPAAYNPAAGGSSQDNGALIAEVRALRAAMADLLASSERGNAETSRGANAVNGRGAQPIVVQIIDKKGVLA